MGQMLRLALARIQTTRSRLRDLHSFLESSDRPPEIGRLRWERHLSNQACRLLLIVLCSQYLLRRHITDRELRELDLLKLAGHRLIFVCNHRKIPFLLAYLRNHYLRKPSRLGVTRKLVVVTSAGWEASLVRFIIGEHGGCRTIERGRTKEEKKRFVREIGELITNQGYDVAITLEGIVEGRYAPQSGAAFLARKHGCLIAPVQYYTPKPFPLHTRDRMELPTGWRSVMVGLGRPLHVEPLGPPSLQDHRDWIGRELGRMEERERGRFREDEKSRTRKHLNYVLAGFFTLSVAMASLAIPSLSLPGFIFSLLFAGCLTIANDGLRSHVMEFEEERVRAESLTRLVRAVCSSEKSLRTIKIVCGRFDPSVYGAPEVRNAFREAIASGVRVYVQLGDPLRTDEPLPDDGFPDQDPDWREWQRTKKVMIYRNHSKTVLSPHFVMAGDQHIRIEEPHGVLPRDPGTEHVRDVCTYYCSRRLCRWFEVQFERFVRAARAREG